MSVFQLDGERKLHCVTTHYKLVYPEMTGLGKSATKVLLTVRFYRLKQIHSY